VQTIKYGPIFGGAPVCTSSSPSSKDKGPDFANKAATSEEPKLRDLMPLDLALDENSAQIPLTQQPIRPQLFETGAPPGWETRSSGGDGNNCLVYIR
jgi:hypothetical protein